MAKHPFLLQRRWRAAVRAFREATARPLAEERTALDTARDVLGDAPVAVDIGANVGRWTHGFLDLYPQARVVMVEAQPELMPTLRQFSDAHPSIIAVNAVLSDAEGEHDFYVCHGDRHSSGSSLLPELTGAPLERRSVTTTTVDTLLESLSLTATVDIMKLDTQGSELDILRGASRTLETVKCLQLEISLIHYNKGGPLLAEVVAFLRERGFFVRDLFDLKYAPDTHHLTHVDCIFSRSIRSITDLAPW